MAAMRLIDELRRRHVFRAALAYLAAAWLLIQVLETLFPIFGLSETSIRVVVVLLAVGFIPAVMLSWVFDWTPEGFKRDSEVTVPASPAVTRRLDRAIIVLLALAVTFLVVDELVFDAAPPSDRLESIAVLAFEDLSPERDQEWFAEGLSEELLNLLAGMPELRVAARTSAFSFKDSDATIVEIADALDVDHIVEGSVRRFEDRIRVTVQLLDARSDTHLWSQNYDREFRDIFDIQDEIARSVVDQLQLNVFGQAPETQHHDPQAYALYLQARTILNYAEQPEHYQRAIAMLEQALEIDPAFVDAIGLLARWRWILGFDDETDANQYERVRAMIERGYALEPENGHMLAWKASISMLLDNDLYTAARYLERAHALDPTNYELIWGTVRQAAMFGRPRIGIELGDYIVARDPLCLDCYINLAEKHMEIGQYKAAEDRLRQALALFPGIQATYMLGQALLLGGRPNEALEFFETAQRMVAEDGDSVGVGFPGHLETLHALGMTEAFDAMLPKFLEFHAANGYELIIAQHYAWMGDSDKAFEWLNKHDRENTWGIRDHLTRPWYRKLHDDPRWQALLEEYQMTAADFEAIDLTIRMPPDIQRPGGPLR